MMKNLLCCLLPIAVLSGITVKAATACEGAPDITCAAFETLNIDKGPTVCSNLPSVDCKVVEDADKTVADAFQAWFDEGFCDAGAVNQASKTIAGAFAKMLVNGLEKVECEGKGVFCGYEISDNAWALSLQEMFVAAAAKAGIEDTTDSFCYGDLRSVSERIQTAVTASSAICTQGGTGEDYAESVVEIVAPTLEDALNRAKARTCGDRDGRRKTWCSRSGGRKAPGGPAKPGDPCGGMGISKQCSGSGSEMCCSRTFRTTICACRGCNGPWIRKSKPRDTTKIFADRDGSLCTCPNASGMSIQF